MLTVLGKSVKGIAFILLCVTVLVKIELLSIIPITLYGIGMMLEMVDKNNDNE